MLTISLKSLIVLAQHPFEKFRPDPIRFSVPHLADEFGPCLDDPAIRAERIFPFAFNERLLFVLEEILGQLPGVLDALYATVHVTSVS